MATFVVEQGTPHEERAYYDHPEVLRQLGLVDESNRACRGRRASLTHGASPARRRVDGPSPHFLCSVPTRSCMSPDDLADRIQNLLHRETQVHAGGVDLTVAAVHTVSGPGQVDFGGGELADATTGPIDPAKRDPDDDYGWWQLGGGTYLVEYNESLTGEAAQLQPRVELVERGVSHPTLRVDDLPLVPIAVPPAGIQLKENARVSTLVPRD
jgi:hypothetical protein